jgi:hypothetical protein
MPAADPLFAARRDDDGGGHHRSSNLKMQPSK